MKTNEITLYEHAEFGHVRTFVDAEGKVWFCGSDICKVLEYTNSRKALKDHVDASDVTKSYSTHAKGGRYLLYVSEAGLYSLVIHSKMPKARAFYEHLTHKVLPQIGRTGMYATEDAIRQMMANPEFIIHIATEWKKEKEARIEAEERLLTLTEEQAVQYEEQLAEVRRENVSLQEQIEIRDIESAEVEKSKKFIDSFMDNGSLLTITQIANLYGWSAIQLNKFLEDHKIQRKVGRQYILCSGYQNKRYTQTIMVQKNNTLNTVPFTKWTMQGLKFIYDLLKTMDIVPIKEREEGQLWHDQ